jgi:hypothetical protein
MVLATRLATLAYRKVSRGVGFSVTVSPSRLLRFYSLHPLTSVLFLAIVLCSLVISVNPQATKMWHARVVIARAGGD